MKEMNLRRYRPALRRLVRRWVKEQSHSGFFFFADEVRCLAPDEHVQVSIDVRCPSPPQHEAPVTALNLNGLVRVLAEGLATQQGYTTNPVGKDEWIFHDVIEGKSIRIAIFIEDAL